MKQKSTVLVIRVEPEVHKRLQQRAESEERSQATLIRKAIREFLENKSDAVRQDSHVAFAQPN